LFAIAPRNQIFAKKNAISISGMAVIAVACPISVSESLKPVNLKTKVDGVIEISKKALDRLSMEDNWFL
jgi:hypothetical protein